MNGLFHSFKSFAAKTGFPCRWLDITRIVFQNVSLVSFCSYSSSTDSWNSNGLFLHHSLSLYSLSASLTFGKWSDMSNSPLVNSFLFIQELILYTFVKRKEVLIFGSFAKATWLLLSSCARLAKLSVTFVFFFLLIGARFFFFSWFSLWIWIFSFFFFF